MASLQSGIFSFTHLFRAISECPGVTQQYEYLPNHRWLCPQIVDRYFEEALNLRSM